MSERQRANGSDACDVLVIGGGPAGATTAALLKRHGPSLGVVLVEAAAFPRYHIGESLVLEVNRILAEMGALDVVERAGFLKKGGATYVWGADRVPWSFLFEESTGHRPHFDGASDYTYHVERARFDALLLDCARGHGVEILQPARVTRIVEDGGRVVGATVEPAGGAAREIRARYVVDASGRAGVVARGRGQRVFDPVLRNVACFGYFRGARIDERYSGSWERARICIVTQPGGWLWTIPIEPGVLSVGAITSAAAWRESSKDPEATLRTAIASAPEVAAWLDGAELVDFHGAPRRVMVEADFNYLHDRLSGPGYALVGDAAGFLDPLFTFGVFLSMTGARLLAYTLGTLLDPRIPAPEEQLFFAYDAHLRSYFDAFRAMLYVFYGFNSTKEDFWARTRALVRGQALPADLSDREAFMAATFGYGVNTLLFHECIQHFGQVALHRIRDMLLGQPGGGAAHHLGDAGPFSPRALAPDARPRLIAPYTVASSCVPLEGSGRMVPMAQVEFQVAAAGDTPFPRRFFLPDAWLPALARMDGATPLRELVRLATAAPVAPYLAALDARHFLSHAAASLVGMGVARA